MIIDESALTVICDFDKENERIETDYMDERGYFSSEELTFEDLEILEKRKQGFFSKMRNGYLGGSEAAAFYGKSPWQTRIDIFYRKTGRESFIKDASNEESLRLGHELEPLVRSWFSRETGFKVETYPKMVVNSRWPHLAANIDGLLETEEGIGIYEGKTTNSANIEAVRNWKKGEVPIYYLMQCFFYMAVLDLPFTYICCAWAFGSQHMNYVKVDRLPSDVEEEFMNSLERFMAYNVAGDIMPEMPDETDSKLILKTLSRTVGVSGEDNPLILDESLESDALRWLEIENEKKNLEDSIKPDLEALKSEQEELKAKIGLALMDNKNGVLETESAVYSFSFDFKSSRRIDSKALKENYPGIYSEVYVSKPAKERCLCIKKESKS